MSQGKTSYSTSGCKSYTKLNQNSFFSYPSISITFSYGLQLATHGLVNQELLSKPHHIYFEISSVSVHNQYIWPHQTVTHKLQTCSNDKHLASLQSGFLITFCMSLLMWHLPTALEAALATPHSGYLYHTTHMMSSSSCQSLLQIMTTD